MEKITWKSEKRKFKKIEFEGYNPYIKQLRSDKGWRVEIEVSQDQYDRIKELPKIQDKRLKINIEEIEDNQKKPKEEFEVLK